MGLSWAVHGWAEGQSHCLIACCPTAAAAAAPSCRLQAAAVPALRDILCQEILAPLPPAEGGQEDSLRPEGGAVPAGAAGAAAAAPAAPGRHQQQQQEEEVAVQGGAWYEAEAQRLLGELSYCAGLNLEVEGGGAVWQLGGAGAQAVRLGRGQARQRQVLWRSF